MTRLALVRHAKSDWGSGSLSDHDRPLNDRGMRDAPRMAAQLAATGFVPDVVLASTATRAQVTASFFAREFGLETLLQQDLYSSSPRTILEHVVRAGVPSVLLVAHNPGVSMLAHDLSRGSIGHMPTSAVATFVWESDDWDVASAIDPDEWTFDSPSGAND